MAQYRCCATSPLTGKTRKYFTFCRVLSCISILSVFSLFPHSANAGLYEQTDQIILLSPSNVDSVLFNSPAALLVEFYVSWCGHCVNFSPIWKRLARDTKEWKPAVDMAAIDCAEEENRMICVKFGIRKYPTLKFFHSYSKSDSEGLSLGGRYYDTAILRKTMIDMIEMHKESWPPACPPLEAASKAEINNFFESNNVEHLALVFEKADSYVGREVTLDLLQFENIAVRRVLDTEEDLIDKLGVTEFPSCYLYSANGTFSRLKVQHEARTFYSYALRRLRGVVRAGIPTVEVVHVGHNKTDVPWRNFTGSRVYMSDLESALHFSLRVEVASHPNINGLALSALRRYVSVLAKYFPGRPVVRNMLQSVDTWLTGYNDPDLSYSSLRALLDNTRQNPPAALPQVERWVGCQGSQPHFRRYPCSVWTLFHVLTVQANNASSTSDPQEVLQALREYVRHFFGCQPCAAHFESMAQDSMDQVETLPKAVEWLWSRHNLVNNRLAGALSEDPHFPKVQWPTPDMCPKCHELEQNGDHKWNKLEVLAFLMDYYSSSQILNDYLEPEAELLKERKENFLFPKVHQETKLGDSAEERAARVGRDTRGKLEQDTLQEEVGPNVEEDGQEPADVEENPEPDMDRLMKAGEGADVGTLEPRPWARPKKERSPEHWPVIVGLRPRVPQEEIVDLDSFVQQQYKADALRAAGFATNLARARRSLRADTGNVGLEPLQPDDLGEGGQQLQKHSQMWKYVGLEEEGEFPDSGLRRPQSPWISALTMGFSRLDVSLCMLLYILSSLCLLVMYRCFKIRARLRPAKVALP